MTKKDLIKLLENPEEHSKTVTEITMEIVNIFTEKYKDCMFKAIKHFGASEENVLTAVRYGTNENKEDFILMMDFYCPEKLEFQGKIMIYLDNDLEIESLGYGRTIDDFNDYEVTPEVTPTMVC